jgi:transmembrane sensor
MQEYYKKIAGLIAKEIVGGLSSEEKEDLDAWLDEKEGNRQLFNEIKKSGNFREWARFQETEQQPAWEKIYTAIQTQKKRSVIQNVIRIAASILLPLLIGGGVYFFVSRQIQEQTVSSEQVAEITPGTSKAVLVLDDGRSVILDTPDKTEIREKDGTVIRKAERKLDYSSQEERSEADRQLFNTIRIPRGAEYDLVLSDSTRVFLNAMSEFRYPVQFTGEVREVELKGEAYFEVSRSGSPFIVNTGQVNVEVLGTEFNVNAYDDTEKIITTLVNGKVKVAATGNPEEGRLLQPAEQAVFSLQDGNIEVEKVDVSLFTSWKDGEFIFYDTRLEDIMITLTRWYSADVFYMNPSVKDLRFGGTLDKYGDIGYILDIIKATNKVTVEVNGTAILFREKI